MGGKPRVRATTESFPFVGAGDASYFEWATVHVRFERAPSTAERDAVARSVPLPLRSDVTFTGAHLSVSSEQGVGRWIESSYGPKAKPPTALTTTSRFKMASTARCARFNRDIERWLIEAHGIVPILIAFRRQDAEAGGTQLSAWHERSLERAANVVAELSDSGAEQAMRRGVQAELDAAAAADETSPEEEADRFYRLAVNVKGKDDMLRRAREYRDAFSSARAWWCAADDLADHTRCFGSTQLQIVDFAALAHTVYQGALAGMSSQQWRAAYQFRIDEGLPLWRLARIVAVALETALRCGDAAGVEELCASIDVESDSQRSELVRAADALDKHELSHLADRIRTLVGDAQAA